MNTTVQTISTTEELTAELFESAPRVAIAWSMLADTGTSAIGAAYDALVSACPAGPWSSAEVFRALSNALTTERSATRRAQGTARVRGSRSDTGRVTLGMAIRWCYGSWREVTTDTDTAEVPDTDAARAAWIHGETIAEILAAMDTPIIDAVTPDRVWCPPLSDVSLIAVANMFTAGTVTDRVHAEAIVMSAGNASMSIVTEGNRRERSSGPGVGSFTIDAAHGADVALAGAIVDQIGRHAADLASERIGSTLTGATRAAFDRLAILADALSVNTGRSVSVFDVVLAHYAAPVSVVSRPRNVPSRTFAREAGTRRYIGADYTRWTPEEESRSVSVRRRVLVVKHPRGLNVSALARAACNATGIDAGHAEVSATRRAVRAIAREARRIAGAIAAATDADTGTTDANLASEPIL